jgi:hypothetical protein
MGTLHHVASGSSANEKIYYTTILSQLWPVVEARPWNVSHNHECFHLQIFF